VAKRIGMFEQYRKTLVGTQPVIGLVTLSVFVQTHRVVAAAAYFAIMQVGALVGAAWAASMKNRIANARGTLRA
jgi:hypothetical protein